MIHLSLTWQDPSIAVLLSSCAILAQSTSGDLSHAVAQASVNGNTTLMYASRPMSHRRGPDLGTSWFMSQDPTPLRHIKAMLQPQEFGDTQLSATTALASTFPLLRIFNPDSARRSASIQGRAFRNFDLLNDLPILVYIRAQLPDVQCVATNYVLTIAFRRSMTYSRMRLQGDFVLSRG